MTRIARIRARNLGFARRPDTLRHHLVSSTSVLARTRARSDNWFGPTVCTLVEVTDVDGRTGIEAASAKPRDVVICDIGLPGSIDGYAVARALRADPTASPALLIALSGYSQEDDRRRAREAGFDAHLAKPADFETLRSLLAGVARREV